MDIIEATKRYEAWLGKAVPLVRRDLTDKHAVMAGSGFGFLRASYYRWAQQFPALCADAAKGAPVILSVGDLHLENFGTWRDSETRLIWGINDFDEACRLPYVNDLVRLAASAMIANADGSLPVGAARASRQILDGYTEAMTAATAAPFVLEDENAALRALAMNARRDPRKFWKKLAACPHATPPWAAKALLESHMPEGASDIVFHRRTAGAGSLGLPRFVATGGLDGGPVAREVKARAPSAAAWASGGKTEPTQYATILKKAVRAPDPFVDLRADWTVRRLAPHCQSVSLDDLANAGTARDILHAMGRETANIHRATPAARAKIVQHLKRQKIGWLQDAASAMADAVRKDWKVWKKRG
jgi:hypothetical protein